VTPNKRRTLCEFVYNILLNLAGCNLSIWTAVPGDHTQMSCQLRHWNMYQTHDFVFDWCCFYYFLRNSLVALLEALFARSISSQNLISKREFEILYGSWRYIKEFEKTAKNARMCICGSLQHSCPKALQAMQILDGISFNFGAIVLDSGWRSLGNTLHHAMITSTPLPIALQLCLDFPASVEEWPGSKHDMKMFIPHFHNSRSENR